jgi:hypothetical protein
MKKIMFLMLFCAFQVNASLINRGNGLIYDSTQNLTWVQDPLAAVEAARFQPSPRIPGQTSTLTLTADGRSIFGDPAVLLNLRGTSYKGYSDWRRPSDAPLPSGLTLDEVIASVNTLDNELYNLFNTVGNDLSLFNLPVNGWVFWSSNFQLANPALGIFSNNGVFQFDTQTGVSTLVNRQTIFSSEWAVRTGDGAVSSVPLPPTLLLFISGLLPLCVKRFRIKKT